MAIVLFSGFTVLICITVLLDQEPRQYHTDIRTESESVTMAVPMESSGTHFHRNILVVA